MKKGYKRFEIINLSLELSASLLACSLGQKESITNVGQEIGNSYDFNGANNTFCHEWESGTLE